MIDLNLDLQHVVSNLVVVVDHTQVVNKHTYDMFSHQLGYQDSQFG